MIDLVIVAKGAFILPKYSVALNQARISPSSARKPKFRVLGTLAKEQENKLEEIGITPRQEVTSNKISVLLIESNSFVVSPRDTKSLLKIILRC